MVSWAMCGDRVPVATRRSREMRGRMECSTAEKGATSSPIFDEQSLSVKKNRVNSSEELGSALRT
jgi:hypothetical protein